jgi:hypothetical protein
VHDIKELVQHAIGPLKKVRIVGRHIDESRERTLTLANHQERHFIPVERTATVEDQRAQVARGAAEFLDRLKRSDFPSNPAESGNP